MKLKVFNGKIHFGHQCWIPKIEMSYVNWVIRDTLSHVQHVYYTCTCTTLKLAEKSLQLQIVQNHLHLHHQVKVRKSKGRSVSSSTCGPNSSSPSYS